jgi:Asp-tRNA(Asn)/Glu-tRNA(Gln) amidotransferase A subunit family amidase
VLSTGEEVLTWLKTTRGAHAGAIISIGQRFEIHDKQNSLLPLPHSNLHNSPTPMLDGPHVGNPYNFLMATVSWTVRDLRRALASGALKPTQLAEQALTHSNQNPSHNTYHWQDAVWTRAEANRVEQMPSGSGGAFGDGRSALWGLPVSVKDCFNLRGAPTSCGTVFYRDLNGNAADDSWVVDRLRAAGAIIIGKTHVHPLTYGITGENPEFGDCLLPGDPGALTGGSSSGAVASVLEGSAVAAIGTDTGGSVRVPAALSGLVGYRSTLGRGSWNGGAHLAESFDTLGWLFRDLEDAPLLAEFYASEASAAANTYTRFAVTAESFLHDCEPQIMESFRSAIRELQALGLEGRTIDPEWWSESREIFARIQAWEAARLHAGHFDRFGSAIRERFEMGASITPAEIATLRQRHAEFNARMDDLFETHQLIMFPCAPVARLAAGADHSQTRAHLLRYTTPFSLAGVPVIAVPYSSGGMQIAGQRGSDESLVQLAARIGAQRKSSAPPF